jgi:hypothetical protein
MPQLQLVAHDEPSDVNELNAAPRKYSKRN